MGGRRLGEKVFLRGEGVVDVEGVVYFWGGELGVVHGKGSREKGFPVQSALVSACCGW